MNTAIFASFTALLFGAYFVIGAMYIIRSYLKPNIRKRMSKTYLKITIVLAALGFVFAILAGVVNYKGNFLSKYPFPGFIIIAMILHLLVLGGAIALLVITLTRMPADTEQFKVGAKHVFFTMGWFLFTALAFNRFGAFIIC